MSQQTRLLELCAQAVVRWGVDSQLTMVAEECAELGAECLRVVRGRDCEPCCVAMAASWEDDGEAVEERVAMLGLFAEVPNA